MINKPIALPYAGRVVIELGTDGQIRYTLDRLNPMQFFGLLECVKIEYVQQLQNPNRIVPVTGILQEPNP